MTAPVRWYRLDTADRVAAEAARRIVTQAQQAIAARGRFRIVLAGGSTPGRCYRRLAARDCDWARWDVYFGDERCLPADHPDRNSVMVQRSLLRQAAIPDEQVHVIPAERGPEAAARAYEPLVRAALPFDLVLAGVGEDGHTASLFPGHDWPAGRLVVPVHDAPKPPPDRVSLSLAALDDCRHMLVLATGEGKRDALRRWRDGADLPVARLAARHGVEVLADAAALPDASP